MIWLFLCKFIYIYKVYMCVCVYIYIYHNALITSIENPNFPGSKLVIKHAEFTPRTLGTSIVNKPNHKGKTDTQDQIYNRCKTIHSKQNQTW